MKAAVYRKFGGPNVVKIEQWRKPVPKDNEVLIKIHAATVSVADHRVRSRNLPKGLWFFGPLVLGVFAPRIKVLGMDLAGTIEAVGKNVTRYKPGDEVIVLSGKKFGGHADYKCLKEDDCIARKPKNMTFAQATSLVFGGLTAQAFLNLAKIKPGDQVLVNGASGAVGSAAVQLASHAGAHVTGVCSGGNRAMVMALGADQVIDYTKDDFAKNGLTYDVIVECVGNAPFARVEGSIKPGGALLLVIADLKAMLTASKHSRKSGKLVTAKDWNPSPKDLADLVDLAEAGDFRPVIEQTYDFADIAAAHAHVDTGHKKGNVVVIMDS